MKFDLFDAIQIMRKHFGNDGEILIRSDNFGITTRLSVFRNGQFYNVSFSASYTELTDAYIDIMTKRFNSSLTQLRVGIPIKMSEEVIETYKNQMKDSDMIYFQILGGDFPTYDEAQSAIVQLYVPDMTISRAGISHALKRLEKFYKDNENERGSLSK